MKIQADKHRTDLSFNQGDLVFVKLQPYKQTSVTGDFHKLSKRFYGPYRVLKKIGVSAYQLQLPKHSRIHNVFHISCLKPAQGSVFPTLELPPTVFRNNPLLCPCVY